MRRPERLGPVPLRGAPLARGPAGLPRLPRAARAGPGRAGQARACWAACSTATTATAILIFTHDNATVYTIARQFLVPVITHQTKTKERREVLLRFNSGDVPDRRDLAGAERGGERPRGQRRDHPLGLGLGPRARPAAGPHPPQVGRQGGHPLRGRHPRAPSRSSPPTAAASTAPTTANDPSSEPPLLQSTAPAFPIRTSSDRNPNHGRPLSQDPIAPIVNPAPIPMAPAESPTHTGRLATTPTFS